MSATYTAPGRLGTPDMTLATDPRLDPRLAAVFAALDSFAPGAAEPPSLDASYESQVEFCNGFEQAATLLHPQQVAAIPEFDNIESREITITGVDGNPITLYLDQPKERAGPAPCVLHTHGGGMVVMQATDPSFVRWRKGLAAQGLVVVGVEFRNGAGALGPHPFPAGLNDCSSALEWVHGQRQALDLSCIVISGESGGGNLSIATALKAKLDGAAERVDGVYAMCPYIFGGYANAPADLPSLAENDTYQLDGSLMAVMAKVYDPGGNNTEEPLAWPYFASSEDLAGSPPHVISVNELDPLRDEGLAFYRKLVGAGVSAVARTVHGTSHAGDLAFPDVVPDIYLETQRSLIGFARGLTDSATF